MPHIFVGAWDLKLFCGFFRKIIKLASPVYWQILIKKARIWKTYLYDKTQFLNEQIKEEVDSKRNAGRMFGENESL